MTTKYYSRRPGGGRFDDVGNRSSSPVRLSLAERLRETALRYQSPERESSQQERGRGNRDYDTFRVTSGSPTRYGESRPTDDTDYKKLYDEKVSEFENLRTELEAIKRKRRSIQREINNTEKELMIQTELCSENQKLKVENGALMRVLSKLSK